MSEEYIIMDVDWLIIGGGIHGVHIAACLIGEAEIDPDHVCILDPGEQLLERWRVCTQTTGMKYLRSPSVHHLDLNPWSLQQFAGKRKKRKSGLFAPPYDRPSLALFNRHCDQLIERFKLAERHLQGCAKMITLEPESVRVQLVSGDQITAQRIVLALGSGEGLNRPDWSQREDDRICHVFDTDHLVWPTSGESVVVVGGGISAGQVALRLIKESCQVQLISRHALRQHQFDSDPGWLGPKNMRRFRQERSLHRRRAMITDARHRGSMPPEVSRALRRAVSRGELVWHEADITEIESRDEELSLTLSTGEQVFTDRVLLATGMSSPTPGGKLVNDLAESASLPRAQCGYPIVDSALRWHPRVHVSGALAELEIGPVSRNIAGARRAATRIIKFAQRAISPA